MNQKHHISGHVETFLIKKVVSEDEVRFDIEIVLSSSSSNAAVRFSGVREVHYGDPHEGMHFGDYLLLSITDISDAGWDGIRFRVMNVENSCKLSLYCRSFEILEAEQQDQ